MTNEEAKELYVDAVKAFEEKDFESALAVFDRLDAERPNSRHVTYHRIVCLANLGRKHEAKSNLEKIEGKLDRQKLSELRRLIDPESAGGGAPSSTDDDDDIPMAEPVSAVEVSGDNVLVIESAFPKSNEETTITGHVKSGAFRTGDSLTIVTPEGMPIVAPIIRIGTAETPLKMARAGQKAIMLLQAESHYVVPGSSASCDSQEESYAETMVVGANDDTAGQSTASQMDGPLIELDRRMRGGDYAGALQNLEAHIADHPDSCPAHRLLAKAYLEGDESIQNPKKALEHVRRAYELGGADDPVVVDLLAQAMAANNEAEHGLRFLERLYSGTQEFQAKAALAQRIVDFRARHNLGHIWEFADNFGDVIFESGDMTEIARAIQSGTVPKESLCKKDHVGEWRKIEDTIALEVETIGVLFKEKQKVGGGTPTAMYILIAVLAVAIVAALFLMGR